MNIFNFFKRKNNIQNRLKSFAENFDISFKIKKIKEEYVRGYFMPFVNQIVLDKDFVNCEDESLVFSVMCHELGHHESFKRGESGFYRKEDASKLEPAVLADSLWKQELRANELGYVIFQNYFPHFVWKIEEYSNEMPPEFLLYIIKNNY